MGDAIPLNEPVVDPQVCRYYDMAQDSGDGSDTTDSGDGSETSSLNTAPAAVLVTPTAATWLKRRGQRMTS